jgi:ATP phosphoribosyltransferase regulatory subunit
MPTLYGDCAEVLARARKALPDYAEIREALDDLQAAAKQLQSPVASLSIDLADLRGYHYHTGMVFAAYHAGSHDAIALGGRYDDLGKSFGRARAATGFSMDLRQLYQLMPASTTQRGVLAPHREDTALHNVIEKLRATGEVVVVDLLGDASHQNELQCDRELILSDGAWVVVELKN